MKVKTNKPFRFTPKQEAIFLQAIQPHTKMVVIDGLYGTGKTWLAWYIALNLLNSDRFESIMYLRNPIESTKFGKIGHLPGEASDKLAPFMSPAREKISEIVQTGKDKIPVEFETLGFIRGTTWTNKVVIVDEAASLTKDDLILITSRAGKDTLVIVVGDSINQSDIGNHGYLGEFIDTFSDDSSKKMGIVTERFQEESDIVRSSFVKFVLKKMGKLNTEPSDFIKNHGKRYTASKESFLYKKYGK